MCETLKFQLRAECRQKRETAASSIGDARGVRWTSVRIPTPHFSHAVNIAIVRTKFVQFVQTACRVIGMKLYVLYVLRDRMSNATKIIQCAMCMCCANMRERSSKRARE